MRKPTMLFPNKSNTNQAVQAKKMTIFRKKRNCSIRIAKAKVLISFAVTVKLICAFLFAYAKCWFFHVAAHM